MLVLNAASQPTVSVDAETRRTTSVYDDDGRTIAQVNALGDRNTTVYDAAGRTQALTDARGSRFSFTYDAAGQRTQSIDPLNRRITSAYDAAGRQSHRIDARGHRTSYVYDDAAALTGRPLHAGVQDVRMSLCVVFESVVLGKGGCFEGRDGGGAVGVVPELFGPLHTSVDFFHDAS